MRASFRAVSSRSGTVLILGRAPRHGCWPSRRKVDREAAHLTGKEQKAKVNVFEEICAVEPCVLRHGGVVEKCWGTGKFGNEMG